MMRNLDNVPFAITKAKSLNYEMSLNQAVEEYEKDNNMFVKSKGVARTQSPWQQSNRNKNSNEKRNES